MCRIRKQINYKYRWAETEANQLATWYDIGGIFGSILGENRLKNKNREKKVELDHAREWHLCAYLEATAKR